MIVNATSLSLDDPTLPVIGYHNVVASAGLSADASDPDFPVTNLANPNTFLKWKSFGAGGSPTVGLQYVTIVTAYAGTMDYLAIVAHNFGSIGASVVIEGSTGVDSPGTWFSLVQSTSPSDDTPLIFRFAEQALDSIRIGITGNDITDPEMAVVYAGKLLVMERSLDIVGEFTPINFGQITNIVNSISEAGDFLGRVVIGQENRAEVNFKWITPEWYRANFDAFAQQAQETPFFFAWNPDEYPGDVGYCWTLKDPTPAIDPVTRRMSVTLTIGGVV